MEKLNSILRAYTATDSDTTNKLLGASFVVINKDEILYSGAAGRQGFDPNSAAWTPKTFTWLASVSKLITLICVMMLVESGKANLDDDLRPLIPELASMQILKGFDDDGKPKLEQNHSPITLRHLLTHTLGLGSDIADPDLMKWSAAVGRTATILDFSREGYTTPLKFAPGDGWYYGAATDWAGQVLEQLTGKTLGEFVQERVLGPLGMSDTGFWPEKLPHVADRTADFSFREGEDLKEGPSPIPKERPIESAGAGLFSTASDYAKVLQAVLRDELLDGSTMNQMFSPQLNEPQKAMLTYIAYNFHDMFAPEFPAGLEVNWGFGGLINMADVPGKRRKGSLTWSGMCNSRWWIDRQSDVAAIMVVNVLPHGDPVVKRLYDELERAVYGDLLHKS